MSLQKITEDLQTKIKTLSAYSNRVYVLASREAYFFMNTIQNTPAVVIVHKGSTGKDEKGNARATETHNFDIHIFQIIWQEDEIITDGTNGLMKLQADLVALLDTDSEPTGFTSRVIDIWVTDRFGSQDYAASDDSRFRASTGISLSILEEKHEKS